MENISYKHALKQFVIEQGINLEEIKYWDFLLEGFDEKMAQEFYERVQQFPDLFSALHHNLMRKCMYIKKGAPEKEWDAILKEEKEMISSFNSSS